ncbi:hypothetical protein NLG97_g1712 [Lecanicillium saksenae]|uniref:Uncharacterized protein n=1 Tax=Lecanicillium saksenae TaxID=468837 RepID=A0ACC1R5M9_9HYPO|nr:hypothetical protein NLG97_g1712 [Lecanicillium saksenae]
MAPAAASFTAIDALLNGHVRTGTLVNVIGMVIDFRAPVPTRKEDYKAQIRFYDESTQDDPSKSFTINIFRKPDAMPNPACGDVVVLFNAKLQSYQSELSLMTNYMTDTYVFSASHIPRPPQSAENALQDPGKKPSRVLTKTDFAHVASFYNRVDKERVPTAAEYVYQVENSVQVKEKFCLLKDVVCERFADVIAEVVREPYDQGDKFTLWISDYTEHPNFYHFALKSLEPHANGSHANDSDWSGPYGKRSLQITCWEPHASAIRENKITVGSFVFVRNLQIKWGRNAGNLEGYLREDRQYPNKVYISLLDDEEDGDLMDPRLKETARRRRKYDKEAKQELKSINEAAKAGQKRRAAMEDELKPRKTNAKSKRKETRAAVQTYSSISRHEKKNSPTPEPEIPAAPKIKLNPTIKCENEKQPLSTVAELLETVYFETLIGTEAAKLPLPFINANYRTSVRVKDYRPHSLEEFAFARVKVDIYDALSDPESDSSSDDEGPSIDRFVDAKKIKGWEWSFQLLLEDASASDAEPKNSVWVTVDNHAAQCLLNMNAGDLKNSKALLSQLREKLFYLWGELEEHKAKELHRGAQAEKQARANRPPADSDDEGEAAAGVVAPSNLPFSCCIKQYGMKMNEADKGKADAGEGKRWQRMYGLFGTQIYVPDLARTQ